MKKWKILQPKPGFSMIEILAVLFVVSMALTGIVSLIIQNTQVQSINKNNLIASSLAQEGIELVRKTRDSNWRAGQAFDTNLSDGSYRMDFRLDTPVPITNAQDAKIYLSDGLYINQNGTETELLPTIFSRQLIIKRLVSYDGSPLQVRSLVSWTDHGHPYNYELRTLLFDWK